MLRARGGIIDFLICTNAKENKWHAQQCLEYSQVDATWFVAYLWLFLPYVYWIIPPLLQHVPFSSARSRKTHICVVSNAFRPDQRECVEFLFHLTAGWKLWVNRLLISVHSNVTGSGFASNVIQPELIQLTRRDAKPKSDMLRQRA